MHREKYPEKIPFRLTRMLINAMEVSGIEGNFRFTCESVMRVLRDNRESVMAVLEAFVYDPLINWRLLQPKSPSDPTHDAPSPKMRQRSSSEQDGTRYSSRRTRLTAHTHTRAHAHSLTLNGVMCACAHTHARTRRWRSAGIAVARGDARDLLASLWRVAAHRHLPLQEHPIARRGQRRAGLRHRERTERKVRVCGRACAVVRVCNDSHGGGGALIGR
jgi:hypothetical protein